MAKIQFHKMHANLNDFIIIAEDHAVPLKTKDIIHLCHRRSGIGADQLIFVNTKTTAQPIFPCTIFNADGSRAEQCGNGLRCVARLLGNTLNLNQLTLSIDQKKYSFDIKANTIQCNMGLPLFKPQQIPLNCNDLSAPYVLPFENTNIEFYALNIGNPHAVIHCMNFDDAREAKISHYLSQQPLFPDGVNINFMRIINSNQIECHTHERGAGPTPSCGSGACASAVIAIRYFQLDSQLNVAQTGGQLNVSWNGQADAAILLSGSTNYSYSGNISLSE